MARAVVVEGVGLHTGVRARVKLSARDGPVRLAGAAIDGLQVVSTSRATTVETPAGARVGTVEHCFAALAGLGVYGGVTIEVEGPEMPLLDGGARAWCEALARLEIDPVAPPLRVVRAATFDVGSSRYELEPGDRVAVEVRVDFGDERIARDARWDGDARDFALRIAPARTFALARDLDELARLDLARHVDRSSVVLVTPDAILHAGRPFELDEPARHKLLDLVGDLYVRGGPPVGLVRAQRPGHESNAGMLRRALDCGVIAPADHNG